MNLDQSLDQASELIVTALMAQTREEADPNKILLNSEELKQYHLKSSILDDIELKIFVKDQISKELMKVCQLLNGSLPAKIIEMEYALKKLIDPRFRHYE